MFFLSLCWWLNGVTILFQGWCRCVGRVDALRLRVLSVVCIPVVLILTAMRKLKSCGNCYWLLIIDAWLLMSINDNENGLRIGLIWLKILPFSWRYLRGLLKIPSWADEGIFGGGWGYLHFSGLFSYRFVFTLDWSQSYGGGCEVKFILFNKPKWYWPGHRSSTDLLIAVVLTWPSK